MTDISKINPTLVHCGIDWITVTALGRKKSQNLFSDGAMLARQAIAKGNTIKKWTMSGFIGHKAGQVQYGTRGDECIVRLSGDTAHDHWKEVYDDSDHCTRLDLQATYKLDCEVAPVISRHFAQAKRLSKNRRRAPTVSLLSTNNGPATLYLNKRVSEAFARIYDKGAESGLDDLQRCIRYEVELKGNEAARWSAYLRSHESPDLAAGCYAIQFFEARGIKLGKSVTCY